MANENRVVAPAASALWVRLDTLAVEATTASVVFVASIFPLFAPRNPSVCGRLLSKGNDDRR